MHHWCLCRCWLLLGITTWNLTTLRSHLILAFKATHSKFIQLTFHFYKYFCKVGHAKESLTNQKVNVPPPIWKVPRCSLNIVVVWPFSSKDSFQHLGCKQKWNCKKKSYVENILLGWKTKKGLAWDSRFCYGYAIPSKFQGECKYPKMMQVLHLNSITSFRWTF
jgi:hypothetical protein